MQLEARVLLSWYGFVGQFKHVCSLLCIFSRTHILHTASLACQHMCRCNITSTIKPTVSWKQKSGSKQLDSPCREETEDAK